MQRTEQRFRFKILALLFLLLSGSCKKLEESVPYAPIDVYINIGLPSYQRLITATGGIYYNEFNYSIGYRDRGIIVLNKNGFEFTAYDRTCPYQVNDSCNLLWVIPNTLTVIDSCCGSKFNLLDGSVMNGPATKALKAYNTSFSGASNVLYIFN